jgi:UDP-N-acetylglucosamine acyltransferase
MPDIHPTAIIGERVRLGEGVTVAAGAIIEDDVTVGDHTRIGPRSFVGRWTEVGQKNDIGFSVQLGGDPQVVGWQPVESRVVVGDGNTIREFATIHRAMEAGNETRIGNNCFLMGTAHVAHDCRVADQVVVCNGALLAGHVDVGEKAFISGNCPIHQFVRIGRMAMIRGLTAVGKDVVPFTLIDQTNTVRGLNMIGLRRSDLPADSVKQIKDAYKHIFRSGDTMAESLAALEETAPCPEVMEMIEFIRASKRGICLTHSTATGRPGASSD